MKIRNRVPNPKIFEKLQKLGWPPFAARLLAARLSPKDPLAGPGEPVELLPYERLKNATKMAAILADAIRENKRVLILADYDADGATACTVGLLALRAFGANVGYIIPDRAKHGYGLSPAIAEIACAQTPKPDYILTVDNGISSFDGISRCNALGVPVLVTDHHLPAESTPAAKLIVNPNQKGCKFPSKAMAGVGVMFYVMRALQDELFDRGVAFKDPSFNIEQLLPFVAIGTVADVVALDANNREIVRRGLEMVHEGCGYPGIEALATVSGKKPEELTSTDIGFGLGPRINAAGRLEQMDLGVECLIETDPTAALEKAVNLHALNMERKTIEAEISEEAFNKLLYGFTEESRTVVVASNDWHQGVVGIVASRIKDRVYRPAIVFTMDSPELLKGSARSIPGFHLRDALELLDKRNPGVIVKFGGHAMAAGLTIKADKLQKFQEEFEKIATSLLRKEDLQQILEVDGELDLEEMTLETAEVISGVTWGQAFPSPLFIGSFQVKSQHFTKDGNHLRLVLEKDGQMFEGIRFRHSGGALRPVETLAYKLDSNEFKNDKKLQILVEHVIR